MTEAEDSAPVASFSLPSLWANPQLRYPVLVLVYLVALGFAYNAALVHTKNSLQGLERLTAWGVHLLVGLFTDATTLRANYVTYDGFAVEVITECVGLLEMVIYSACVLAFPAPFRTRMAGIVFGSLAILLFNLLRIATLLVVGRHWSDYFDFVHIYFWQGTLIAIIVSVLYGWIRLFVHRQPIPDHNASADPRPSPPPSPSAPPPAPTQASLPETKQAP